jgi:hypothetical protein
MRWFGEEAGNEERIVRQGMGPGTVKGCQLFMFRALDLISSWAN